MSTITAKTDTESTAPTPVKWTSIELFHNVYKMLQKRAGYQLEENDAIEYDPRQDRPKVKYQAKIKLDGTNGAVHVYPDGSIHAQSRTKMLTPVDDNYGFAKWVEENKAFFQKSGERAFSEKRLAAEKFVVFGEWCGQGIQKRTAISKIDRKIFTVFAIQLCHKEDESPYLMIEPERIENLLGTGCPDVFVLPWHGAKVAVDFFDTESCEKAVSYLNGVVADVEANDPWVDATFGVRGLGEGIVMYPATAGIALGAVPREDYTELMFKAKGEKHQVVKQKSPVQIDPEVAKSIEEFVEMFVTENRLLQAVGETCDHPLDIKQIGGFLRWFGQDCKKESVAELEAAELTWKQVSKAVTSRARNWFKDQTEMF